MQVCNGKWGEFVSIKKKYSLLLWCLESVNRNWFLLKKNVFVFLVKDNGFAIDSQ